MRRGMKESVGGWIQVWYIRYNVRAFVNATMYPNPAQQKVKNEGKNKDIKELKKQDYLWSILFIIYCITVDVYIDLAVQKFIVVNKTKKLMEPLKLLSIDNKLQKLHCTQLLNPLKLKFKLFIHKDSHYTWLAKKLAVIHVCCCACRCTCESQQIDIFFNMYFITMSFVGKSQHTDIQLCKLVSVWPCWGKREHAN
jgi:hypothetical protein